MTNGHLNPHDRNQLQQGSDLGYRSSAQNTGLFYWWWIWLILIFGAFVWFGGWGWWGYGGWWGWGGPNRVVVIQPANGELILSANVPQLLNSPQSYEGKQVLVPGTTVQKIVNRRSLWVGPTDSQEILVSVKSNSPIHNFSKGQKIDVSGTAVKPSQTDPTQQDLGLSTNAQQRLSSEGIFFESSVVANPGRIQIHQH